MIKCKWCEKTAVMKTYRTIDGVTGSEATCNDCNLLSTSYLLKRIKE